jgi:hypothetical protein
VLRCPTRTSEASTILIPNDLALSRGAASAALSNSHSPPCGAAGCSGLLGTIHLDDCFTTPQLIDLAQALRDYLYTALSWLHVHGCTPTV